MAIADSPKQLDLSHGIPIEYDQLVLFSVTTEKQRPLFHSLVLLSASPFEVFEEVVGGGLVVALV